MDILFIPRLIIRDESIYCSSPISHGYKLLLVRTCNSYTLQTSWNISVCVFPRHVPSWRSTTGSITWNYCGCWIGWARHYLRGSEKSSRAPAGAERMSPAPPVSERLKNSIRSLQRYQNHLVQNYSSRWNDWRLWVDCKLQPLPAVMVLPCPVWHVEDEGMLGNVVPCLVLMTDCLSGSELTTSVDKHEFTGDLSVLIHTCTRTKTHMV